MFSFGCWTLGELIAYLKTQDPEHVAPLGIGEPHSWRGSYEELAFTPERDVSVAQMLKNAKSAVGSTYSGWKGGKYGMGEDTPVHLAHPSRTGETIGPILMGYMCGNPVPEGY